MKKNKIKVLLFFILTSCAHPSLVKVDSPSDSVFPDGIYKQNIYVKYKKNELFEANSFKGVLKKEKLDLRLYCYVGFGITLFKINDLENKPLQFLSEQSEIEKNKDFFLKIYPLIKEIIYIKKSDKRFQDKNFKFQVKPDNFWVDIKIEVDPKNDFPKKIIIQNEKYFIFEIANTEYDQN